MFVGFRSVGAVDEPHQTIFAMKIYVFKYISKLFLAEL